MKKLINKLVNRICILKLNLHEKTFINFCKKKLNNNNLIKKKQKISDDNKILVSIYPDYYSVFNTFLLLLDKKFINLQKIGIWTRVQFLEKNLISFILFPIRFIFDYLEYLKWKKIYKALGVNIFYNFNFPRLFFNYFNIFTIINAVNSKKKLITLKIKNISVGTMLYDTYMRFSKKPTFEPKDKFLLFQLVSSTLKFIHKLDFIFSKFKDIKYYLSPLSCYIQYGIPVRYFVNKEIICYGGKNFSQYVKQYSKKDYSHFGYYLDYKRDFEKLSNKKKKLEIAKKFFLLRISGKKTRSEFYMKESSFHNKTNLNNINIPNLIDGIIFLPDFVDAPHLRGKLIFCDFYDFIIFTLNFFRSYKKINSNFKIAIKPHPNSKMNESIFINELKNLYPEFVWIPENISNKEIYKLKPYFGISPDGSPLIELTYFNTIAISAGRSPYSSFNYIYEPKNISHYLSILKSICKRKLKFKQKYKNQIYANYYMHYLHNNDKFANYSRLIDLRENIEEAESSLFLKKVINKINKSKII